MVKVIASPQYGYGDRVISSAVAMTGLPGPSTRATATVPVTLPPTGVGIISALIDSVVPVP